MSKFLNFFKNSQGNNTLEVVLDNNTVLLYQLSDNPAQHIWQSLLKSRLNEDICCSFDNQTLEDNVKFLNTALEKVGLPSLTDPNDREKLNYLHSQFAKSGGKTPAWKEINKRIHQIENYQKLNTDFNYAFSMTLDPPPPAVPINETHKLWLSTDHTNWGMLSLGYETVGKDWVDISIDNDHIEEIAVKNYIGTETWFSFVLDPVCNKRAETRLWQWYLEQPSEIQKQIPIDNLNSLALGDYLLGKIIVNDTFLNFHPNASDWYVPNHICKLQWNEKVLSTATSVVSYRFFDSDIAYDTLVKHTGFNNA